MKLSSKILFLIFFPFVLMVAGAVFLKTTNKVAKTNESCLATDFSGIFDNTLSFASFEGQQIPLPLGLAELPGAQSEILGVATPSERWIEVDLSEQKLRAWDGNQLFTETLVSTGLPGMATPKGEYRIWAKLRYVHMKGGSGRYAYDLPNVPYVMFFGNESVPNYLGYSLHGTYWHNDFGRVHSHGCVNLPTPVAEKLYSFVTPLLAEGKSSVWSSAENPGTRIVVHD